MPDTQMAEKPESCPTCNRYTERGRQQLAVQNRSRPIYGTDFSRPLSEIVGDIRSQLARARGQLSDIGSSFTGWKEHIESVEGLLTCGLVALYDGTPSLSPPHPCQWSEDDG
jgi:hypothetical protein